MKTILLRLFLALVFGVSGFCAESPEDGDFFPADEVIQGAIQARVDQGWSTGIVVGVLEADGTSRVFAYGDAGSGVGDLSRDSVFEIGSITKTFTGAILAQFAAEGLLDLDDPVAKHTPEGLTMPTFAGEEIRLVDLATHRSGLPRMPTDFMPANPRNPYADYTTEKLFGFISRYKMKRVVGAEYEYSNLGVGLLGQILCGKTGLDYEALVKQRILDPLGMSQSGITITKSMEPFFVKGHDADGVIVPYWDLPAFAGAGALRSSMDDMLKYLDANLGEPKNDLERAMRMSHEPRKTPDGTNGVGLCWHVQPVGEGSICVHDGATAGFTSFMAFDPEREIGVVLLSNSAQSAGDIGMSLITGRPLSASLPMGRVEVEVATEAMEGLVGVYELNPSFVMSIRLEQGSLQVQATNQPKIKLYAESELKYFMKAVDAQIEFVVEDGQATSLILHQNGMSQTARRRVD